MSQIIASRKIGKGIIVQKQCSSCHCAFWSGYNDHKSECADCDPPEHQPGHSSFGRNMDKKRSDTAYHGAGYQG